MGRCREWPVVSFGPAHSLAKVQFIRTEGLNSCYKTRRNCDQPPQGVERSFLKAMLPPGSYPLRALLLVVQHLELLQLVLSKQMRIESSPWGLDQKMFHNFGRLFLLYWCRVLRDRGGGSGLLDIQ